MNAFHETLFPLDVALGARGGPERRTDVVTLGSNRESRNTRWADSRRQAGRPAMALKRSPILPYRHQPFSKSGAAGSTAFAGATRATFSSALPGASSHTARSDDRAWRRRDEDIRADEDLWVEFRTVCARDNAKPVTPARVRSGRCRMRRRTPSRSMRRPAL